MEEETTFFYFFWWFQCVFNIRITSTPTAASYVQSKFAWQKNLDKEVKSSVTELPGSLAEANHRVRPLRLFAVSRPGLLWTDDERRRHPEDKTFRITRLIRLASSTSLPRHLYLTVDHIVILSLVLLVLNSPRLR